MKIMKKHDDQAEDWKSKYLRALADYQNLEKRTREEIIKTKTYAEEEVLRRLLPFVDTLTKAKNHLKDAGLDLAQRQLSTIFTELGVEKIETLGREFDPYEMECIEVTEGEDNRVVAELLTGYRLHGKMLRVAQVKVGKKSI